MSKKEGKDSYAVIVISKLLRIIDLEMIEDLQEAESTKNVSRNLEIAGNLASRKGKNFFSKSSERINKILHKSGSSPIFNQPLCEANVHRISSLIEFLKQHLTSEGIFRISGSKKRQEELKHLIDQDDVPLNFEDYGFTEHDVASIFKYFLAELPEPIITRVHVIVLSKIKDVEDSDNQLSALQLLLLLLPPANRHLLQQLLLLLNEIANIKENKMTAQNLATVFAPSVIHYKHKSSLCLSAIPEDLQTFTSALTLMIEHAQEVFVIPDDLMREIEKQKSCRQLQDSDAAVLSKPFCTQIDARLYSTAGNKCTSDALVDLYTQMAAMEDTPMKRQFLKNFADFYPGTPPFKPKTRKPPSENEKKSTFSSVSVPKILSPRHRRVPLQSANRMDTQGLCESPAGHYRPLNTPIKQSFLENGWKSLSKKDKIKTPGTPSRGLHRRSPSLNSLRNVLKKRRRSKTIESNTSDSSDECSNPRTPKPRRSSSSSDLEKKSSKTTNPFCSMTGYKTHKTSTVTPIIKKSLIGRDIRNLYATPMNSSKGKKQLTSSIAK
ncbi:rho GTPase-activating protein 19-like isoform X2 [Xenia sp. Carnegie-2017]|uniref:rho GTPase-activating protein 19-like isoform X2 n=1 Tax=Xenia sp. Carnegie-2017 TaxID=2897299 RepID=UPI001F04DAAF|nr:rho GTPase-activating protein 19-like isoform X2 [Xenia sp. Carnegie-2017]